ncbi:LysM peptidoglycan-binding domain-containing protein [Anoxybacteroides tepidamans]|uniref:LysM peptidoglycan-binding domain-containing protein n=1 Tax=Anoxybacteroides tepidamans TaxID=265948 RepID=UPI00048496EF|nr:LysM peptidoglycan-binding domain-containing protein [Anoxybacillus tepidamans]
MKDVRDQAEELRKQVGHFKQKETGNNVDALSLPPRSEVHKQKQAKKKTKWKIKYPLIRLLALFFILLPISILSIYYMNDKPVVVTVQKSGSYEPIDIANYKKTAPHDVKEEPQADSPADEADKKENTPQVTTHVVKENETLFSIAMHYYNTEKGMEIIKKWNHLKTSQLHKGQILQIPEIERSK